MTNLFLIFSFLLNYFSINTGLIFNHKSGLTIPFEYYDL